MVGSCRRRARLRARPRTKEPHHGRIINGSICDLGAARGAAHIRPRHGRTHEPVPARRGLRRRPTRRAYRVAPATRPTAGGVDVAVHPGCGVAGADRPGPRGPVAAVLGELTNTVVQRRHRAEARLATALAEGKVTALQPVPSLALLACPPPPSGYGTRVSAGVL